MDPREELLRLGENGRIFSVRFTKRTTGESRNMVARLGVHKGVTGAGLRFDPTQRDLMVVYDVHNRGFRMVDLRTVERAVGRGRVLEFGAQISTGEDAR